MSDIKNNYDYALCINDCGLKESDIKGFNNLDFFEGEIDPRDHDPTLPLRVKLAVFADGGFNRLSEMSYSKFFEYFTPIDMKQITR